MSDVSAAFRRDHLASLTAVDANLDIGVVLYDAIFACLR